MKTLILSATAALLVATNAIAGELPFGPPSEPTVWGHKPHATPPAFGASDISTTGLVRDSGRWLRTDRQPDGRDPAGADRGR